MLKSTPLQTNSEFLDFWADMQAHCETQLKLSLSRYLNASHVEQHSALIKAIEYALLNGGKRVRAVMVYACAKIYGIEYKQVDAIASAIECIHAYSLVHDDMPEMDNDTYRRGKLSTHAKFGQATALLVGDNLQSLAFELLSDDNEENSKISPQTRLKLINHLARASGIHGMIGGQALDLSMVHSKQAKLEDLQNLHLMKTGALFNSSVIMPAFVAAANDKDIAILNEYCHHIGLLFQITDDILDETGSQEVLGKSVGKDSGLNKLTYTSLLGLDESRNKAIHHCQSAKDSLKNLSVEADFFTSLSDFILFREN